MIQNIEKTREDPENCFLLHTEGKQAVQLCLPLANLGCCEIGQKFYFDSSFVPLFFSDVHILRWIFKEMEGVQWKDRLREEWFMNKDEKIEVSPAQDRLRESE